jgi:hypothetical protein
MSPTVIVCKCGTLNDWRCIAVRHDHHAETFFAFIITATIAFRAGEF